MRGRLPDKYNSRSARQQLMFDFLNRLCDDTSCPPSLAESNSGLFTHNGLVVVSFTINNVYIIAIFNEKF